MADTRFIQDGKGGKRGRGKSTKRGSSSCLVSFIAFSNCFLRNALKFFRNRLRFENTASSRAFYVEGQDHAASHSYKRILAPAQGYLVFLPLASARSGTGASSSTLNDVIRVLNILVYRVSTVTAPSPEICFCAIASVFVKVFQKESWISKTVHRTHGLRFFLASRAATAFRARSERCSGVMVSRDRLPPILPPLEPWLRKYSSTSVGSFFAMLKA
jgi:hypothetical protein